MAQARLDLTRSQILAFRQHVGGLNKRLPPGAASLRQAAWAGLQDSMPRAALLSIHARVESTESNAWEDPSLIQLWGPRYSAYVVAAQDLAVFSLARLPGDARGRQAAEDMAQRLETLLRGSRVPDREAASALGVGNRIRYATTTGTVLIRWEGARAPILWTVPRPKIDPGEALLELARRYLHVFGPTTSEAFTQWAGISAKQGLAAFDGLADEITPVSTPIGERWILTSDEAAARSSPTPPAPARLLPSGDAYWLLQGADRELMVPDAKQRNELWTSRVWPGALLVGGEIAGTWRRANAKVSISAWRRLTSTERAAVEEEAASLPLPDLPRRIVVNWE